MAVGEAMPSSAWVNASIPVEAVRPGGRLVYSTCSIEPEEGPAVVRWLCRQRRGLRIETEKMTPPGGAEEHARWHDGGYLAVLST